MNAVDSPRAEPADVAPPLAGLRVLDFTHILAGPFCTRLLADLGAEVLHVETRSRTEGRGVHPDRRDVRTDRNKETITLNLKHEAGRAAAARLAQVADIIVENFSSGVMGRLGLDYESIEPANPRLIYVSMSGFGHTGPRRDWTSMNMNLQGYSGLMLITGAEGDPPTSISSSWNDFIGGLHADFAILQALVERRRTGRGRFIDLAQAECSVSTLGPLVLSSAVNRKAPPRIGNRATSVAPQGAYPCAGQDEWCVISVQNDEQWLALTTIMESATLADEPRFKGVAGRLRFHDEIDEQIGAWTRSLPREEVQRRLSAAGVPAERVRHAGDVVESQDSGHAFAPLSVPGLAKPDLAAHLPFRLTANQPVPPQSPELIGHHTRKVLAEWIGLTDVDVDELEAAGALQ